MPTDQKKPKRAIPNFAKNILELSEILGVHRTTITAWKKQPGCPKQRADGRYLVSEWIEFGANHSTSQALEPLDKKSAELNRINLQCEKLKLSMDIERKKYIALEEIGPEIRRLTEEIMIIMRDELVTKIAPEIRETTRAAMNRILTRWHTGSDEIVKKYEEAE